MHACSPQEMADHMYGPPKGSTGTLQCTGFRENATNLLTSPFSTPLYLSTDRKERGSGGEREREREKEREKVKEREREGEWERGSERMDRGVSECECSVLLTLAIREQHFSIDN